MTSPVRVWQTKLLLSETRGVDPTSVPDDRTPQERRFWARVNWNGPVNPRRPELGPCWLWTGSCYGDSTGRTYGQTSYNGKRMGAHRASFLMHGGVVPDGHDVMHRCDTKACVRPDHLTAGTRTENLLDGFAAPRNQGVCAGENNGRARLTWDDVHAIRSAPRVYGSIPILAAQYGVSAGQINQIRSGRKWPESKCPTHNVEAAA
jgi:hypothetical protein